MLIELVTGGLFIHVYGAYVVLLRDEFGWSATVLSMGFALMRVEQGVLAPVQGWAVDRYGPRRVVTAGIALLAFGLILLSLVTSLETFFIAIVLIAIGASLGGFSSLSVALVNWFERGRSTALGLLSVGSHSGPLLLPLVALSFVSFGWRATAMLSAFAIVAVGVPAAQLLTHRPAQRGSLANKHDNESEHAHTSGEPDYLRPRGFTVREALRAKHFWYLSLGHACAVLVVSAVLVHLVPHLTSSLGLTVAEASAFVALLSVVAISGNLIGGAAGDRFKRSPLLVACMSGHVTGILLLAYATSGWMVAAFALLHGLAWGVRGPLMASIRVDFFGLKSFGTISGMSYLVVMIGMILGPLVAGLSFDLSGSYAPGFTIVGSIATAGAAFFVLASRAAPPLRDGESAET